MNIEIVRSNETKILKYKKIRVSFNIRKEDLYVYIRNSRNRGKRLYRTY